MPLVLQVLGRGKLDAKFFGHTPRECICLRHSPHKPEGSISRCRINPLVRTGARLGRRGYQVVWWFLNANSIFERLNHRTIPAARIAVSIVSEPIMFGGHKLPVFVPLGAARYLYIHCYPDFVSHPKNASTCVLSIVVGRGRLRSRGRNRRRHLVRRVRACNKQSTEKTAFLWKRLLQTAQSNGCQ